MARRIIFSLIAVLFTSIAASDQTQAVEPPSEPILRIESDMHTAAIVRISLDADNRYLVTASHDKTVCVWDVATGNHIRTLRPPIGEGDEGKMYAVAISRDGNTVAAGGWTQFNNGSKKPASDGHTIYLFDRSTGKLKQRITNLPDAIFHLTFSQDGSYLAACLSGKNGIRLYRTTDYSLIGEDKDYGDDSRGANFNRSGGLVTTSFDGFIRLYTIEKSGSLRLIAKNKGKGGKQPCGASFSSLPASMDAQIAVGYTDSTKVDVFSGSDLSHLYSPDTTGVNNDNGNLTSVAWSSDGSLYAGGNYHTNRGQHPIFRWPRPDRWWGNRKELQASDYSITHILPLKNGGIAFAAYGPALGIISSNNERTLIKDPPTADYRFSSDVFLISNDALTVQFGYKQGGEPHTIFSVNERRLVTNLKTQNLELKPPITQRSGMNITSWRYTRTPKLNGKALKLGKTERSCALAIAPSGESFLLGAESNLRLFDRKGTVLWLVPAPGVLREVNVSGNGRIAVAAFGDGTIRWYSMSDGKELLAFFPHKDRNRWVLWTPEGFFDASPGGSELIGYHLNRGKDREADFIPIDKLYNTFYRPDMVIAKLQGKDISGFAQNINIDNLLNAKTLAPKVKMITTSGKSNDRDMMLKAQICDTGGGVGDITLFLDGMPVSIVSADRGVKIVDKQTSEEDRCYSFEHLITLQDNQSIISLMAYNKDNTIESDRDAIEITYKYAQTEKPDLHILTIAIDKYKDGDLKLKYSINDAVEIAKAIELNAKNLFNAIFTYKIYDEDVTKDKLNKLFEEIGRKTKREDVFILFVAGHGITNEKDGAYYYLPVNFQYTGDAAIMTYGVSMNDFRKYLSNIQAMKSLLLLDTCNSGSFAEAISSRGILEKTAITKLTRAVGRATIVASSKNQVALEGYEGHGVFTYALLEALKGKAADKDGKITINGMATYVEELLPQLTYKKWGYEQIPQKMLSGMDFPIAVMK
jgi:WD40 repeat protein